MRLSLKKSQKKRIHPHNEVDNTIFDQDIIAEVRSVKPFTPRFVSRIVTASPLETSDAPPVSAVALQNVDVVDHSPRGTLRKMKKTITNLFLRSRNNRIHPTEPQYLHPPDKRGGKKHNKTYKKSKKVNIKKRLN